MRVPPGADDTSGQPLDLSPNVRQCSGHSAAAVPTVSLPSTDAQSEGESAMPSRLNRRDFVKLSAAGVGAAAVVGGRRRAAAATSPYPDWLAASAKPPKRGGTMTRASAWDPPVIDPRHTQSVGLFQFAGLTSNRLVRYPFTDEATGPADLTLKGDLAESWQSSPDHRVWTFK
ncbi:MAG: hypothetical protein DME05_14610, partial [Candidatus Rokuibacteriota bacterium]